MEFISFIIDFVLHIDQHLLELVAAYGPWIYLILFLIVFAETGLVVTPFLPGDSLLFVAGAIAAMGEMNVHLLVALLILAAVLGDAVNYAVGHFFGMKLFSNPDSRIFRRQYLDKTHDFYARHGGKTMPAIAPAAVPRFQKNAPAMAGNCAIRPAEAMEESTAINPRRMFANTKQATVSTGLSNLPQASSFSSERGKNALRRSLPNIELNVRMMEFSVDTAAAKMLRTTSRARPRGTFVRRAAMALSGLDSPGTRRAAESPRATQRTV